MAAEASGETFLAGAGAVGTGEVCDCCKGWELFEFGAIAGTFWVPLGSVVERGGAAKGDWGKGDFIDEKADW